MWFDDSAGKDFYKPRHQPRDLYSRRQSTHFIKHKENPQSIQQQKFQMRKYVLIFLCAFVLVAAIAGAQRDPSPPNPSRKSIHPTSRLTMQFNHPERIEGRSQESFTARHSHMRHGPGSQGPFAHEQICRNRCSNGCRRKCRHIYLGARKTRRCLRRCHSGCSRRCFLHH